MPERQHGEWVPRVGQGRRLGVGDVERQASGRREGGLSTVRGPHSENRMRRLRSSHGETAGHLNADGLVRAEGGAERKTAGEGRLALDTAGRRDVNVEDGDA